MINNQQILLYLNKIKNNSLLEYTAQKIKYNLINKINVKKNIFDDNKIAKINIFYYQRLKYLNNQNYFDFKITKFSNLINYYLIHDTHYLKSIMADKIQSCNFIYIIINRTFCKTIYKIYNNPNLLEMNNLPKKFIIKVNHACGNHIIVNHNNLINFRKIKKKLKKYLMFDYGIESFEFHYSYIHPKFFIEKLIENIEKNNEYKFFMFRKSLKFLYCKFFIKKKSKRNFYNSNFTFLDIYTDNFNKKIGISRIQKPQNFNYMKIISKKIGKIFNHVRVDLYEIKNKIIFSELTFSTCDSNLKMNSFDFYLNY